MTAPHFFWNQPELGSETMESGMTAASPCPVCPARRNRNHRRVAYLIAGMLSASSHSNIPYARADMSSPTLRASNTVSMRDTAFQCVTHAVLPHRSAYRSEPRPHDSSMDICEHIIPNPVLFRLWWDDDSWRRNRFSAMTAIPSHPERAIPFASSSLMIPRRHPHRGHPFFFAGNADSLMSIRDWYSRFARLTGIMRKYMPGFVRWDMTMASPSPVSCAVGHIENNSHNNTIHDFMISRWQNSVSFRNLFLTYGTFRETVSILQRLRFSDWQPLHNAISVSIR